MANLRKVLFILAITVLALVSSFSVVPEDRAIPSTDDGLNNDGTPVKKVGSCDRGCPTGYFCQRTSDGSYQCEPGWIGDQNAINTKK